MGEKPPQEGGMNFPRAVDVPIRCPAEVDDLSGWVGDEMWNELGSRRAVPDHGYPLSAHIDGMVPSCGME